MSRSSSLADKATLVILGRAAGALSRIFAIIVLARVLDKETFGLVSFVLISYITVSNLVQLGLSESVFYFVESLSPRVHMRLVWCLARLLAVAGVAAGVILLMVGWAATARGYPVNGLLIPLALLALLELPTMPVLNLMIAVERPGIATVLNVAFGAVLFAALTTPAWLQLPVKWISYCLLGYGVVRLVVSALVVLRTIPPASKPEPPGLSRDLLRYSVPLGLGTVFSKLTKVADKYVVMWLLPAAVFAEYSVGSWEIPIVPLIAGSVSSVMMTHMVKHHLDGRPGELLRIWSTAIRKVTIVVIPVMVLLVLVANELVVFLFTEKYSSAAVIFMIYTLVLFHRVTDYAAVLKAMNETRHVTRWLLLVLVTNLALSVPLVMALGAPGAAWSALLSAIVGWLFVLHRIAGCLQVAFAEVFPFRFYFKTLVVAAVSTMPAVILDIFWQGTAGLELLAKALLFGAVYYRLSIDTGVCEKSDWAFVGRIMGRRSTRI